MVLPGNFVESIAGPYVVDDLGIQNKKGLAWNQRFIAGKAVEH